jgi:hypothetical protein
MACPIGCQRAKKTAGGAPAAISIVSIYEGKTLAGNLFFIV